MDPGELLARYEARGKEDDFFAAKPLFEQAIAESADARLFTDYGYLLESHGRSELRQAVALYERAIELDPDDDKPHYQLIGARAGLREPERAIALYEQRPGRVAALGARAPLPRPGVSHGALTASRGEAKAGLGDVAGALADWRLALQFDPEDIGALYSTAFLLEREDRVEESAEAWRAIIDWNDARGQTLESEWPRRELERLRAELAA